jgi:hypothetical protein
MIFFYFLLFVHIAIAQLEQSTLGPQSVRLCTSKDIVSFDTYPTWYDTHADSCATQCLKTLTNKGPNRIEFCIRSQCRSFSSYNDFCVECFVNFLTCQSTYCNQMCFDNSSYTNTNCKECANLHCKQKLVKCIGIEDYLYIL